jgi:hypothetical protein
VKERAMSADRIFNLAFAVALLTPIAVLGNTALSWAVAGAGAGVVTLGFIAYRAPHARRRARFSQ